MWKCTQGPAPKNKWFCFETTDLLPVSKHGWPEGNKMERWWEWQREDGRFLSLMCIDDHSPIRSPITSWPLCCWSDDLKLGVFAEDEPCRLHCWKDFWPDMTYRHPVSRTLVKPRGWVCPCVYLYSRVLTTSVVPIAHRIASIKQPPPAGLNFAVRWCIDIRRASAGVWQYWGQKTAWVSEFPSFENHLCMGTEGLLWYECSGFRRCWVIDTPNEWHVQQHILRHQLDILQPDIFELDFFFPSMPIMYVTNASSALSLAHIFPQWLAVQPAPPPSQHCLCRARHSQRHPCHHQYCPRCSLLPRRFPYSPSTTTTSVPFTTSQTVATTSSPSITMTFDESSMTFFPSPLSSRYR